MFGLCLQEPMALITNWLIAFTAFFIFFRFKPVITDFDRHWKKFYLYFGMSTLLAGLGHLFFNYTEVFGKYPTWIFGTVAAYHAGSAMISLNVISEKLEEILKYTLYFKAVIFLTLALIMKSFIFIMMDAVVTYLFFCLGLGSFYWRKGLSSFKYTVFAVVILIPSIFIFTLKLNPHLWFNKDDFSHVLMATTIIFFYFGVSKFNPLDEEMIVDLKERS